ncbi:MAG: hypothetical protein Q7R83_02510 [bacterium]|nr:hypothetical protein [bacterium]
MILDPWLYSAKRAWQNKLLRGASILAVVIVLVVSSWFLWKMIPARKHTGMVIFHYNIYLGVDQMRPWYWIFLLPAGWLLITLLDLILAFGFYYQDAPLANSLVFLSLLFTVPVTMAFFYLLRMNI